MYLKEWTTHVNREGNIKNKGSSYRSGLKVCWMTWTVWVTYGSPLVGQVGLLCKLNHLDVTQIFNISHAL